MVKTKKWNGYTSWSYLEPKVDYDVYPLEKQVGRVPPYDLGLTKKQEEHAQQFIENNLIFDLHEHMNVYPKGSTGGAQRRLFKAYESMATSGIDAVIDNVPGSTLLEVAKSMGQSMCDYAHQDFVIPGLKVDDITTAFKEGKVAVVHGIESASAIANDVDNVDVLFGLGIRTSGLVYSDSNQLASGLGEINDAGLTDLGYDAVKRMNKTGIMIDTAHASDRSTSEIIDASSKPVVISHRGTRTLTNTTRMISDEILKACAEKGGVLGVEVAGFGLRTKKHPDANLEGAVEHAEYCIKLLGVDHVAFGPDTMFNDHAGMYRAEAGVARGHYPRPRPKGPVLTHSQWRVEVVKDLDYVKGLESATDYANLVRCLIRDGYSDQEVAKVMGLNTLRVVKACWPR